VLCEASGVAERDAVVEAVDRLSCVTAPSAPAAAFPDAPASSVRNCNGVPALPALLVLAPALAPVLLLPPSCVLVLGPAAVPGAEAPAVWDRSSRAMLFPAPPSGSLFPEPPLVLPAGAGLV
jgi:hypothetical protein